jgi:hypothetical protein
LGLDKQVERYHEWLPRVVEARVMARPNDGVTELGRQQLLKSETDLGRAVTIQEVVAWDPPNKITWQHLKDTLGGKEFTHAREIKTTMSITNNDGEVTFRLVGSWKPAGISGKLMNRVMKRSVAKNFEKALDNLQLLINQETVETRR